MNKKIKYAVIGCAACCVVCLMIGFFAGRHTITYKEEVRYVKGETYSAYLSLPEPKTVQMTDGLRFSDMVIPDSIVFPDDVDLRPTAYDWNLERRYLETLFDNQYGKMTLDARVQYNKLQDLKPVFVPIQKEVIRHVVRTWTPFVSGSYSMLGFASVGGGVFYRDWGVQVQYVTDWTRNGVSIGLMRKF
jgi:hypothetical protein